MSYNADEIYNRSSNYLKAVDLQKRRVNLTIADVELLEIGKQEKLVLCFEGTDKKLVLNIINKNTLTSLVGSALTQNWIGYTISLRPDITQFQNNQVECIRIDFELPEQKHKKEKEDEVPPF